ncbi:MAG: host attachment protein [Gemmatimonadaceae bacterium]|nr:host attachment protein [Acetobacteraceae bacterium]
MSKTDTTWYVVADGGKARILIGEGEHVRTVHTFDADGRGEVEESASAGPNQLKAPHSDPKEQSKAGFAKVVAGYLNHAVKAGEVDAIVLAAPAHMLHDIREDLDKPTAAAVTKSMPKDYTNVPDRDLAATFL